MIITILKYIGIAVAVALVLAFIIFICAMAATTMLIIAEETENRPKDIVKEELTDGDNEA